MFKKNSLNLVYQLAPIVMCKDPFTQGCDLRATFERLEKWWGRSVVVQTQKVLFLCNCCSTTLVPSLNDKSCCSGATGCAKEAEWRQNHCEGGWRVAVVAEWRHSGRHCDRSMDAISRPKEAQWWYKEGRRVAQIDTQCSQQYVFFTGRPMADHCASILPPRRWVCLPPASFERPTSSATFVRLFWTCSKPHGDHGVHGDVWTSCVPPLNDPRQPFCLLSALNGDLGTFVVAQWRQKGRSRCKGGITHETTSDLSLGYQSPTWKCSCYVIY